MYKSILRVFYKIWLLVYSWCIIRTMPDNKIVILGAGFGGLTAAIELGKLVKSGRLEADIILVDKNPYHTYTPTLYEAAATSKDVANYLNLKSIVTMPIDKIIKDLPIKFINDEVIRIETDRSASLYLKDGGVLTYEYLILALGSETNYFDIPGLKENSLQLKNVYDAFEIRDAAWSAATCGEGQQINVIVGGGGSTGVELASELKVWLRGLEEEYKCRVNIKIVEANSTVLKGFSPKIIASVTKRLKKIGVELLTEKIITHVSGEDEEPKIIKTRDGDEIPYDVLVWTGGVTANRLIQKTSLKLEHGRAEVGGGMTCFTQTEDLLISKKMFAVGDIVCIKDKEGNPVPMVARAAIDQAKVAAKNISRDINQKSHVEYKPHKYPYIIAVGGKFAVAKLGPFVIKGFTAWLLKGLVELNYLFSIMPKLKALRIWLKGFFIFMRNDRLG